MGFPPDPPWGVKPMAKWGSNTRQNGGQIRGKYAAKWGSKWGSNTRQIPQNFHGSRPPGFREILKIKHPSHALFFSV